MKKASLRPNEGRSAAGVRERPRRYQNRPSQPLKNSTKENSHGAQNGSQTTCARVSHQNATALTPIAV